MRPTGGQYLSGSKPVGNTAASRVVPQVARCRARARCAAHRAAAFAAASHSPAATLSISPRMAIIASQNRSSSARSSLSVGSTISVPATGKRHRRRVEAVVDQPLGDVVDADAGLLGQRAQVEDALVRDPVVVSAVEHREVLAEPLGHVVGGEHGHGGRVRSAPRRPSSARRPTRSAGCPAEPYGAALIGPMPSRRCGVGVRRVAGQVRRQVRAHADRADARAAAAVRDAERLVQVEVRDVAAELAGLGVAEQRVEVRPVDVDLATVRRARPRTARRWCPRRRRASRGR